MSTPGFDTSVHEFCYVFPTDDSLSFIDMIPRPVASVIMLFPLTEKQKSFRSNDNIPSDSLDDVWFIKERIGNSCGTICLLHALLNAGPVFYARLSYIFLDETQPAHTHVQNLNSHFNFMAKEEFLLLDW